jgi:hypothetical protein
LSLLKNPFGLRIDWQVKITTDDIDDISSVEDSIGYSCESGSTLCMSDVMPLGTLLQL